MRDDLLGQRYEVVAGRLDTANEGTQDFDDALAEMEALAQAGSIEAAEAVAEIFCFSDEHRDPERAYRWYFRALASQGYTTAFHDENASPPHYCGPTGDFRNEAPVSSLVTELGFDRVQELDAEIRNQPWPRRMP